jgi:uncharacterized protein
MSEFNRFSEGALGGQGGFSQAAVRDVAVDNTFLWAVYRWMTLGLAVTGGIALMLPERTALSIAAAPGLFFGLIIAELVCVLAMSWASNKISASIATILFLVYAVLNGLTFSVIFLAYELGSIASAFFVTAGTFGAMSAWGYFTKRDLSGVGHFARMGLFGLLIATVVNMFWANSTLYWLTTYMGVIVFTLLTAYDTQKIKMLGAVADENSEEGRKAAIFGALTLYLDFINLFLFLLRLLGNRK